MATASRTSIKGRGAASNPEGRFEPLRRERIDDGWESLANEPDPNPQTVLLPDATRTLIARNQSPDVGFDRSINPYKGCEHGCVYCFARPTHAYLDLSPGIDFETRIFYKTGVVERLRDELGSPSYRCAVLAMGTNTDPYQPAEKKLRITRSILETLLAYRHPVSIVTKGTLIERDLDLLMELAKLELASVMISVTTLDNELKATLEPRAAAPQRRLALIRRLADSGVPVGVLIAPVIPVEDVYSLLDWPGGVLLFQSTPLSVVAQELGRQFGRRLVIVDEALGRRRVTAWFDEESFEEILSSICLITDARCAVQSAQVTLSL